MRGALLLAAVLVAGGPAAAQEPWRASYYPYPLKGPNDKLSLVAHWHTSQAADYYDAVPFAGILSVEAGANADGSRFGAARFRWPRMAEGWRLYAEAGRRRENRFGYFGIGNAAAAEPDDLPPDSPYGWRVGRTRTWGRVELTRQIYGPARVALSGGVTDASYRALPGESVFRDDHAVDPGDTDATVRLTLIVDSRDNEVVPSRGALLEGGCWREREATGTRAPMASRAHTTRPGRGPWWPSASSPGSWTRMRRWMRGTRSTHGSGSFRCSAGRSRTGASTTAAGPGASSCWRTPNCGRTS
jgi:hypothetical protein